MAFNLTAELQLQANNQNINQVVNQIQQQLRPIGDVNIKVNTDTKAVQQAANQVQRLDKGFRSTQKSASELNRTLVESARRFSVITVATGSLLSLVNAFKNSVKSALDFEVELAKISQVTGKTVKELSGLSTEVRRLSTELGVGNASLIETSRILLQTGLSAQKTKQALDVLARTTLAATFDDIQDTTEGAIALLNQFGGQAKKTGQDIVFLEQSLDAINAVSKKFAVESSDLIGVVRRVGGVFSSAGGNVNELIALFTSVRQTTRESAETISTGLRTIFTRLQRTDTVEALRRLNIELQDSKGQFVGAFEAVKRLSVGLSALDPKDFRFSAIVEELGGFRQVGKVIPLIKQFAVAQNALNVAQNASGSILADSITAQKTLANRFAKTREKFDELIAQFVDSSSFRSLASGFLIIADSLIKIGSALEPVLPLLTALFALKVGSGLASGIGLLRGISGGGGGGSGPIIASRFATGGPVPGSGSRDTVPAMLTPGEFVIRKSSVKKLGMNNLAQMNAKGYATGGKVGGFNASSGLIKNSKTTLDKEANAKFDTSINRFNKDDSFSFSRGIDKGIDVNKLTKAQSSLRATKDYKEAVGSGDNQARGTAFENIAKRVYGLKLSTAPNARIDAIGRKNNELLEIKSEKGSLSDKGLSEKAIGAAINPKDKATDGVVAEVLTSKKLTRFPNDIDLPNVGVVQDTTNLSKINSELKTKDGKDITQGAGFSKRQAQQVKQAQKAALGGFIQKFAAGGAVQSILKQSKVGAANLDVGKDSDVKLGVTPARVNATDPVKNNNFLKNKAGVRKYIESQGVTAIPSYTLNRKSLDKSTGDKFRANIVSEVTSAADRAAGKVGQDLIGKSVKASEGAKETLSKKLVKEGGVIGSVFEDVLNIVGNQGNFAPTNQFQPFDFPNGLSGPLADNYTGLPSSFVDSRKKQTSKDKGSFETKVANQIALEAAASEFGRAPSKEQKKMLGGMIKRLARGGSAGGDTVPALLTPGEFVLNKKAAQGIGAAKLDAMNKRGEVQGFNKGGAVQYLASGGAAQGPGVNNQGQSTLPSTGNLLPILEKIQTRFEKMGVKGDALAKSMQAAASELSTGKSEADAFKTGLDSLKDPLKKTNAELKLEAQIRKQGRKDLGQSDSRNKVIQEQFPAGAVDDQGNKIGGQFTGRKLAVADETKRETLQTKFGPRAGGSVSGEGVAALTKKFDRFASSDKGAGASTAQRKAASDSGVKEFLILIKKGVPVQKAFNQSIKKTETELDKYKSITKRINERNLEAARIKDEEIKASQDLINQKKKEEVAESRQKKPISQRLGGALKSGGTKAIKFGGEASQGFADATKGGQNLIFAGAAIAAVTSQLGIFDEATEKAITSSSAFAATTVGLVGSIGQTVAGFTNSAVASQNSALADQQEAASSQAVSSANQKQAASGAGFGKALGGFAIGLSLGISALQFFAAKNKAVAEKNAKAFDNALKGISESGNSAAADLISSANAEVAARTAASNQLSRSSVGTVAGFTAAGAAIGSFIPVIGTFVGALIGAAAGVVTALLLASRATEQQLAQTQKFTAALAQNITALDSLAVASAKATKELADIENTVGLSGDDKNRRKRNVVGTTQNELDRQKFDIAGDNKLQFDRDKGESELVSQGAVSANKALQELSGISGKTFAELSALDTDQLAEAFKGKRVFDDASGFEGETSEADAQNLSKSFQVVSAALEQRAKAIEQNLSLTSEILSDELSKVPAGKTFDELTGRVNSFSISLARRKTAIQQASKEEIAALKRKEDEINSEDFGPERDARLEAVQKDIKTARGAAQKRIKDEEDNIKQVLKERDENRKSMIAEQQARKDQIALLKEQSKSARAAAFAARAFQLELDAVNAQTAQIQGGTGPTPQFDKVDTSGDLPFDELSTNLDIFLTQIGNLPANLQAEAKKAAQGLADNRQFIDAASKGLGDLDSEDFIEAGNPDAILKQVFTGLDTDEINAKLLSAFGGSTDAVTAFKKQLETASVGSFDAAELDSLFAPLRESGASLSAIIDGYAAAANTQLQITAARIKQEDAVRKLGADAIASYSQQVLKGRDIIAKAEGRDPNVGKAATQRRISQAKLDAGQASRGGVALNASDPRNLNLNKKSALAGKKNTDNQLNNVRGNQAAAQQRLNDLKAQGKKGSSPEVQQTLKDLQSLNQSITGLQQSQAQYTRTIQDADSAQQAYIQSLDSEIAVVTASLQKAAAAREQGFAVLSEFVLGGQDTRDSLNSGAAGIFKALQTGTVQNQSEEQRSQTIGLLDKLKDVQIPGSGGLTGSEVKQELVFQDAVRLGFPPEVAKELATSTTVEQDMLAELKRLVAIQEKVAAETGVTQEAVDAKQGVAGTFSTGGVVYRANGGSIFKPKGTDTVPAMLTPGEFVIKKSAVDKVGAGNLAALNNGNGAVYRANGGPINKQTAVTQQGQGGGIQLPSAEQFASALKGGVNSLGPGKLKKLVKDNASASSAKDIGDLIRNGNFDISRFIRGLTQGGLTAKVNKLNEVANQYMLSWGPTGARFKNGTEGSSEVTEALNSVGQLIDNDGNERILREILNAGTGRDVLADFKALGGALVRRRDQGKTVVSPTAIKDLKTSGVISRKQTTSSKAEQNLIEAGLYLAGGGSVAGSDTIPAMLTPGEFVMSREAVQRNGVGYMKNLNKGVVKGFRRGGIVGTGNVRYRAGGSTGPEGGGGGGGLSIDPSGLQQVLTDFGASFGETVDNVVAAFSTINTSLDKLANAINQGMTVTHQFSGDMKMAFKIENGDQLKNSIAEALTPKISKIISEEVSKQLGQNDFKAGG
jgi:hypothetical protein